MSSFGDIKNSIVDRLETIKPSILKDVISTQFKSSIDALNNTKIPSYPVAIITPPRVEAQESFVDNMTMERRLKFAIIVIENGLNITDGGTHMEDLMNAVMDVIDDSITLSGTAPLGILPTSITPEPFEHNGESLIEFEMIVTARDCYQRVTPNP